MDFALIEPARLRGGQHAGGVRSADPQIEGDIGAADSEDRVAPLGNSVHTVTDIEAETRVPRLLSQRRRSARAEQFDGFNEQHRAGT